MATTISNATLTVQRIESVTLNGKEYGNTNSSTFANINEVDQRIVIIPTSEITVLAFGAAAAAGTFVRANLKFLRIINKDDTNFISIKLTDGSADHVWLKIPAGCEFTLGAAQLESASSFSAFADITTISAIADTAAVHIEYFIALT
jgi:hypothetical protein